MKKAKQSDASHQRILPPLEHLTLEDWARICERVEQRYATSDIESTHPTEAVR